MPLSKLLGIAFILITIWGLAYPMVSVGVQYMSPIWLVASRCLLGAFLVSLWALYRGHKFPRLTDRRWLWYLVLGNTGMVLPFWLLSKGQITVDSGLAAIIAGTMPLLTIILSHFFANEPLTPRKMIGFAIGFLGTIILFLPEDLSLTLVADWRAQLLIVAAAVCYAVTTILAKRAPDTPASLGGAMMLICAGLIASIIALSSGIPEGSPAPVGMAMVIGLGIGSTGIATILYLYVIAQTGPSTLAKINYFPPVVSVLAGVFLLNEEFTWKIVAAFVMILIGVLVARSEHQKPL